MLIPVQPGEIGTVVTHLVQDAPPPPASSSPLRLEPWPQPDVDAYRDLFRAVGAPWLWYSRLTKPDAELARILGDPATTVLRLRDGPDVAGFSEIHMVTPGVGEIAFLGLVPGRMGRGEGRWLLAETCRRAWAVPGVTAVRVNTCTLDHPAALPNYLKAGFRVTGRSLETFPDPRLTGVLPVDEAPQTPVVPAIGAAGPSPAS